MSEISPVIVVPVPTQPVSVVVPIANPVAVMAPAAQGLPGKTGPIGPSGGSTFARVAADALSGHRWVYEVDAERVAYASCDDLANFSTTLGLTLNAAGAGDQVNVTRREQVTHEGWSWARGPVFLGLNGQLTQRLPAGAQFSLVVGFSPEPTVLFVDIGIPFLLENSNGR